MGLDTSHNCWHGPYSSFSRWREAVARAAGYAVWPVQMDDGVTRDTIMLDWGRYCNDQTLIGDWTDTPAPDDALVYLFTHQDCEGVIHPEQGRLIADRLEEVLTQIDDTPGTFSPADETRQFIAGLREAADNNEDVEFH
jgi:hypothetical protein